MCCNQSLAIEIIWTEITLTVWHIHQFHVGKTSNFSRMPCKAVRIESFLLFFNVCVKTQNTQTSLPNLHRNNSCLLRLQEGESHRKWTAGSVLPAGVHRIHGKWLNACYIYTADRGGKNRSAHSTHGYSHIKDVATVLFACFTQDRFFQKFPGRAPPTDSTAPMLLGILHVVNQ